MILGLTFSSIAGAANVQPTNLNYTAPATNNKTISIPNSVITQPIDLNKFSVSKMGTINPTFAYTSITAAQMPNGKILAAWETFTANKSCVGEAVIFSSEMQPLASVYYTNPAGSYLIGENVAFAIDNNTVLIAYADKIEHCGKYVIVNDSGKIIKGPVVFNDSDITTITLSYLPGRKTILLAYQKLYGVTGRGEYQVLNASGDKIWGPIIFNNKGYTTSIGAAMINGLVFLSYNCAYAKNKILDVFGNVIRDEIQFLVKSLGHNQPLAMENGNILLVYQSDSQQGVVSVIGPQGTVVAGPTQFTPDSVANLAASRLNDGNIFVLYTRNENDRQKTLFTLLDADGNRIKELKLVHDQADVWDGMAAHVPLQNGKVLIIYGGVLKNNTGTVTQQFTNYLMVK